MKDYLKIKNDRINLINHQQPKFIRDHMNVNDINMGVNMGHWNEKNLIGM